MRITMRIVHRHRSITFPRWKTNRFVGRANCLIHRCLIASSRVTGESASQLWRKIRACLFGRLYGDFHPLLFHPPLRSWSCKARRIGRAKGRDPRGQLHDGSSMREYLESVGKVVDG